MTKATKQVNKKVPNPTGKGGFQDHPELRSDGGWKKEMVFSYQYKRFMNMSLTELDEFARKTNDEKTVVEELAYKRVLEAKKSLADVKEITDRTEGKAQQSIDLTSGGEALEPVTVRIISEPPRDTDTTGV